MWPIVIITNAKFIFRRDNKNKIAIIEKLKCT